MTTEGEIMEYLPPEVTENPLFQATVMEARILNAPRVGVRLYTQRLENDLELLRTEYPDMAEVYLVLGNFYEFADEPDNARENWEYAASLEDAPEWVVREASSKLDAE
jgi:hypothetical protein